MKFQTFSEFLNEANDNNMIYVVINKNYTSTWRNIDDVESYLKSNEDEIDKSKFGEITNVGSGTTRDFMEDAIAYIKDYKGKVRFGRDFLKRAIDDKGWKKVTRKRFEKRASNSETFDLKHPDKHTDVFLYTSDKGSFFGKYKDIPSKSIENGDEEDTEFYIKEL